MTKNPLDLAALRARLSGAGGKEYWRSLEELAGTQEFREFLEQEFPQHGEGWDQSINRRQLLRVMGASFALAGLTACSRPVNTIVPYVIPPEQVIPGRPLFFATAMPQSGIATGLLVESNMGRPTKIEGNPGHPASLGATDAIAQASLLSLYDPDRSQVVTHLGNISSWVAFLAMLTGERAAWKLNQGAGLRVLTETVTSPTLANQLKALLAELPKARWHQYEPAGWDNVRAGSRLAFGEVVNTYYDFEKADVILSLDADFLRSGPGTLRYTRDFSRRRREAVDGHGEMPRLYVVETMPTSTGAMADHHLAMRAGEMEAFVRSLSSPSPATQWGPALAHDLQKHRGRSIVMAGPEQSPVVHALVHQLNHALGNVGQTVIHTASLEAHPVDQAQSLKELVTDMQAGQVDTLVILGGNPVYYTPEEMRFSEQLRRVRLSIHVGQYLDETGDLCHWHLPEAHYLESWGDTKTYDGAISFIQPLIAPLYNGKTIQETMDAVLGHPRGGYDIVREYWKRQKLSGDFEATWRKALHDGILSGSAAPPKAVTLKPAPPASAASPSGLELVFRPDPHIGDGRDANNGWLQEIPKPVTKLTWDNAAFISPATAQQQGLQNQDWVDLVLEGRSARAPIWILPGHAKGSVTIHLGFGRTRAGRVGNGTGYSAYRLRSAETPWIRNGLQIRKTGGQASLGATQEHHSMEGRDIVRVATIEEFRKNPKVFEEAHEPPPALSLYPEIKHDGYAWGMAIDLTSCVGCNACVAACQAENNSPVVGRDQVMRGREMHWIRIDRYYQGSLDDPATVFQPVMCQHCENAPCEVVCPVAATTHSPEGLNEMIYNRCVGTRYCSNNCPYKVRRFNFYAYQDWETPSLKLMRNPNVTVRSRGVMEKCTYCVQRINRAKIEAEKEDRDVRDGEIVTACQAVCPASAIVFGNLNDPASRVSKMKAQEVSYRLLEDLNTRPRTTYQARLRNPNPEIAETPRKDSLEMEDV